MVAIINAHIDYGLTECGWPKRVPDDSGNPIEPENLRMDEIMHQVCEKYGLKMNAMKGTRRARNVAWPRQEAMYRCYKETGCSLPQIGRFFGGRDHTTVMHAIKRVEERMRANGAEAT